jgi:uncharacterized membrane protein YhaH (DUF805 family)
MYFGEYGVKYIAYGFVFGKYSQLNKIKKNLYRMFYTTICGYFYRGVIMNWYLKVLKNYAGFSGRAQRAEYWFFFLFNMIASILLLVVDGVLGTFDMASGLGLLYAVYSLAVLIPSVAVSVRRLHDIGKSGWWLLIAFIPFVGPIVLLVFFILDSQVTENTYGPNPKGTLQAVVNPA